MNSSQTNGICLVNLALQGGGSHGAFTWGVLDALLEDGRVHFDGISGTSAGAMNAVALAHGFAVAQGKSPLQQREAARESLAAFWDGIIGMGALSSSVSKPSSQRAPFDILFGQQSSRLWTDAMTRFWSQTLSPYQSNPFDINPLRQFLEQHVDFERLAAAPHPQTPKVFVAATRVSTGKAEVFSGARLTARAVMASACLPMVFQAVEIDGEAYWDGGYSGNPAIHPLIYHCDSRDIVLVQINPIVRTELPTRASAIMDRLNEITFNSALIAEMRAIDFVKRLLAEGKLDSAHYKNVLMHRVDGGQALAKFEASTKQSTEAGLIHALRDLGIQCGKQWLLDSHAALGVRDSINIAHDYLDDLRVPVTQAVQGDAAPLAEAVPVPEAKPKRAASPNKAQVLPPPATELSSPASELEVTGRRELARKTVAQFVRSFFNSYLRWYRKGQR
jgi:NTE family protein